MKKIEQKIQDYFNEEVLEQFSNDDLIDIVSKYPLATIFISPTGELSEYELEIQQYHYHGYWLYLQKLQNIDSSKWNLEKQYSLPKDGIRMQQSLHQKLVKENYLIIRRWISKSDLSVYYHICFPQNPSTPQYNCFCDFLERKNIDIDMDALQQNQQSLIKFSCKKENKIFKIVL